MDRVHKPSQETAIKTPKLQPLDAAAFLLGAGLLAGLVARIAENSRQLAALFGF
jgi:hypothetical protein